MFRGIVAFLLVLSLASLAGAQGQAINGTIEGTVTDESGGVLPGVVVTVTNIDTGETRSVITNDGGVYRAPLLPLGAYRVTAELQASRSTIRPAYRCQPGRWPWSTSSSASAP